MKLFLAYSRPLFSLYSVFVLMIMMETLFVEDEDEITELPQSISKEFDLDAICR